MRLPVYLYGHPVLRKTSTEIAPDYEGLSELIEKCMPPCMPARA